MKPHDDPHKEFEKSLSENHAGYVLITCDQPSPSGEMKVVMTYGGSVTLANMLIDGAQSYLDESIQEDEITKETKPDIKLHKS